MIKKFLIAATSLGLLLGCGQNMQKRADFIPAPKADPEATYVGSDTCYGCHDTYQMERHNVHMRIADFEVSGGYKTGCEACHGPGSVHVDSEGDPAKILVFGKDGMEPEAASAVCTTCHNNDVHMNWPGSVHSENEVGCAECHKVHDNRNKKLLVKPEMELCATCHQDVNAQMMYASHHPLKEGKMGCSDCHNPHGSDNFGAGMLKTTERANDLCLKCHTRYQGPFAFEHDPVVEDCMMCHNPHGTVANNLLKQQEPFLCLQCHEGHFHAARASNSYTDVSAPVGGATASTTDRIYASNYGFQKSFLTKCTQCHTMVHGSDLPAQSATGQGKSLTR